MDDIYDFLPKYPNIDVFKNKSMNPYGDEPLNLSLYHKKELYQERLDKYEPVSKTRGVLLKHQKYQAASFSSHFLLDQRLLIHEMGCLEPSTMVLMHDQTTKRASEVKEGDLLMGDDGISRTVLSLITGESNMYRIIQENGAEYIVNSDHVLSLRMSESIGVYWSDIFGTWLIPEFDVKQGKVLFTPAINLADDIGDPYNFDNVQNFARKKAANEVYDIILSNYLKLPIDAKKVLEGYKYASGDSTYSSTGRIKVSYVGVGSYVGWSLTGNRRFLLADGTVTHNSGKSCTATAMIEQIKSEGTMKGALYLAKGEALLNNFRDQVILQCTDGRYIPEGYDKLTKLEQSHRKNKSIQDFYTLNTFEKFAKKVSKLSDSSIQEKYNNHVIVIDEVHNLRIQDEVVSKKKQVHIKIYDQIHRFLHTVRDCKVILMSGTPMKDSVAEIASVMNLILPASEQLPTEKDFLSEYFSNPSKDLYLIKKSKIDAMKRIFKGRISYLRSMQSDVTKVYKGTKKGNLKYFNVVSDKMSDFQTRIYEKALETDKNDRQGIYKNARQASLFVFPDSSYGTDGFNKYVINKSRTVSRGKKKHKIISYKLTDELYKELKGVDTEDSLTRLYKYSSKYAASIRLLLESQKQGKVEFIYNDLVQGSGLILFSVILDEIFGFTKATGNEQENDERPRYAILTNITVPSATQLTNIINRINKPDNVNGKIIGVVMGSEKITEGFSIYNVQVEDIHTPWFNYSEIAQAEARGTRLGSHRELISTGVTPTVDIYQRVSIPRKGMSIDLYMYEISEVKDVGIKGIERLMRESAIDCAAFYYRNYMPGNDNQRDCDYQNCDYVCDGVPQDEISRGLTNDQLDLSTYQLYFMEKSTQVLIKNIITLYQTRFSWSFDELKSIYANEYSDYELLTALRALINQSIRIYDKYGFPSFLREEYNVYFLVGSLSVIGKYGSEYYTKYPHIRYDKTFNGIIKPLYYKSLSTVIQDLFETNDLESITDKLTRVPLDVQEIVLEGCILAKEKHTKKNVKNREKLLENFSGYYSKVGDMWVSTLLIDTSDTIRCLSKQDREWTDCDESAYKQVESLESENKKSLETNKYGYYGMYNPDIPGIGGFCIRDVTESQDVLKGHKRTKGKKCVTWTGINKAKLADTIVNKFDIPFPSKSKDKLAVFLAKKNKEQMLDILRGKTMPKLTRWLLKTYQDPKDAVVKGAMSTAAKEKVIKKLEKLPEEKLRNLMLWYGIDMKPMCEMLKDWFDSKKLLVPDRTCGTSKK